MHVGPDLEVADVNGRGRRAGNRRCRTVAGRRRVVLRGGPEGAGLGEQAFVDRTEERRDRLGSGQVDAVLVQLLDRAIDLEPDVDDVAGRVHQQNGTVQPSRNLHRAERVHDPGVLL